MVAVIREIKADDPLLLPCLGDVVKASQGIWAGFWDGELVAMWGLVPESLLSDTAYIWSYTTPVVTRCKKTFLKVTKAWIKARQEEYPRLVGLTNCKTSFIKHIGADFGGETAGLTSFIVRTPHD